MSTHSIGGGPALFRLVRYWARRWQRTSSPPREPAAPAQHVQVLEAIDAAAARGAASVADVAGELGLDRSGASRLISSAAEAGYVEKVSAAEDARRAELAMTRRGRALLQSARSWQQHTFEQLVADWPRADARRFETYLERLARQSIDGGEP